LPGYDSTADFVDWTSAVVDPATGTTHVFFHVSGTPPTWGSRLFYQAVDFTNTLQAFENFPGNTVVPQQVQNVVWANPIIVGNNILLGAQLLNPGGTGAFTSYESLIIGVGGGPGITLPVFSYLATPGIDPIAYNVISPGTDTEVAPFLLYDGRTIFVVYLAGTNDLSVRVCYTNTPATPTSGWTSVEVFNSNNVGLPFNAAFQKLLRPALNLVGDLIYVTVDAQALQFTNARYNLGAMYVEPIRIQLRGVKRYVRTKRKQVCAK
jgi:hypothetical protein